MQEEKQTLKIYTNLYLFWLTAFAIPGTVFGLAAGGALLNHEFTNAHFFYLLFPFAALLSLALAPFSYIEFSPDYIVQRSWLFWYNNSFAFTDIKRVSANSTFGYLNGRGGAEKWLLIEPSHGKVIRFSYSTQSKKNRKMIEHLLLEKVPHERIDAELLPVLQGAQKGSIYTVMTSESARRLNWIYIIGFLVSVLTYIALIYFIL